MATMGDGPLRSVATAPLHALRAADMSSKIVKTAGDALAFSMATSLTHVFETVGMCSWHTAQTGVPLPCSVATSSPDVLRAVDMSSWCLARARVLASLFTVTPLLDRSRDSGTSGVFNSCAEVTRLITLARRLVYQLSSLDMSIVKT